MPTWVGAVQAFRNVGANIVSSRSMTRASMTALDRELRRLREQGTIPKFIYANANFQNPTGATMSLRRRQDLLALARAANTPHRGRRLLRPEVRRRGPTHHLFARRQRLGRLHGHPVENHGSRNAAWLAGRPPGSSGASPR